MSYTTKQRFKSSSFQIIKEAMLQSDELPLADVIDEQRWQECFDRHDVDFGTGEGAIYTPAIVLWGLISQVFFSKEHRSCKAAVVRIASLWAMLGKIVCSTNTGAFCRARMKLGHEVVRDIARDIALESEAAFEQPTIDDEETPVHDVVKKVQSQPTGGNIFLFDGLTITAADTEENQAEFPQPSTQAPGLGFPSVRCVTLISMTTGMLVDMAMGPVSGKQKGETALLWQMLHQLQPGDILVADCYLCTYWIVAACLMRGVKIVMKKHACRPNHPEDARRISRYQRLVTWQRPVRPDWMSEEEYGALPEQVEVRLVDVVIDKKGFRSKELTIATTILETKLYSREWIAAVYRSRWLVELDIRSIKCSLGMDIVRAKTPAMVRTEIWACLLAYNLIRMKMLQSSAVYGYMPRSLSFTTMMQFLANNWVLASTNLTDELIELALQTGASEIVGNRLDRVEPRANKRRPKFIALLTKPRAIVRQEMLAC